MVKSLLEGFKFVLTLSWRGWGLFFLWLGEHHFPRPGGLSYDAYVIRRYLLTHPKQGSWTRVFICVGVPRGWDRDRFDRAVAELSVWLGVPVPP